MNSLIVATRWLVVSYPATVVDRVGESTRDPLITLTPLRPTLIPFFFMSERHRLSLLSPAEAASQFRPAPRESGRGEAKIHAAD